jgi:hypothetical protein
MPTVHSAVNPEKFLILHIGPAAGHWTQTNKQPLFSGHRMVWVGKMCGRLQIIYIVSLPQYWNKMGNT